MFGKAYVLGNLCVSHSTTLFFAKTSIYSPTPFQCVEFDPPWHKYVNGIAQILSLSPFTANTDLHFHPASPIYYLVPCSVYPLAIQCYTVTHDLGEVRKNYTGVAAEVTRELETSTVLVSLM